MGSVNFLFDRTQRPHLTGDDLSALTGVPMRFASEGMATGMTVCLQLGMERPRRPWAEQVLPFGLAHMWLVTLSGWTLTETSRDVRLPSPGAEPAARRLI